MILYCWHKTTEETRTRRNFNTPSTNQKALVTYIGDKSETENQAQYYTSLRAERFASEACTLFVLGTFLLGYNSVLPAKASVALQTLPTHSGQINDQGFCHVVGEGENTGATRWQADAPSNAYRVNYSPWLSHQGEKRQAARSARKRRMTKQRGLGSS
jgi:hypothetical protein